MAKKRHATLARFEGAATGVGGFVTMVPDLVALAWIQSRLVFYIAAAYGYDPSDPMRPAELLVLFDFYPDPRPRAGARRRSARRWSRPTSAPSCSATRRSRCGSRRCSASRSARKFAGRLIPGVAIAFNAIGNERRTRALADKAIRFYGG